VSEWDKTKNGLGMYPACVRGSADLQGFVPCVPADTFGYEWRDKGRCTTLDPDLRQDDGAGKIADWLIEAEGEPLMLSPSTEERKQ
jgi:hypothetical protein